MRSSIAISLYKLMLVAGCLCIWQPMGQAASNERGLELLTLPADPNFVYDPPLDIPLYLSGTFGELRGSHFHSGMDIRTEGRQGLDVKTVGEGYVSRIKVSPWGFGKALYIAHPSGYTSVYAHLQNFSPKIEEYIRKVQYERKSYDVDEYLGPGIIPIERGEVIAISGNSGGSQGPHLHFEIRNTRSQIPVNPLAYGFDVKDNIPPYFQLLKVYFTEWGNGKFMSKNYSPVRRSPTNYTLSGDTIEVSVKELAFGVETYDKMPGSGSRNGIYELNMKVDGQTVYHFDMDQFSFAETRYIQAHSDYAAKVENKDNIHRLFLLPGNQLSIYDSIVNRGIITLDELNAKKIEITITDYEHNTSTLQFHVRHQKREGAYLSEQVPYDRFMDYRKENVFDEEGIHAYFPAKTFYDNVYFKYSREEKPEEGNYFSAIHHLHEETEPAHINFTVSITPDSLPEDLKDKALIVEESSRGGVSGKGSYWTDETLTCRTRDFGKYYISIDTIPPHIAPVNLYQGKDLSKSSKMQFQVRDVLSGLNECKIYVDGKWILAEYDAKYDLFTYFFDEVVEPGEHILVVLATDNVGNESSYSLKFKR